MVIAFSASSSPCVALSKRCVCIASFFLCKARNELNFFSGVDRQRGYSRSLANASAYSKAGRATPGAQPQKAARWPQSGANVGSLPAFHRDHPGGEPIQSSLLARATILHTYFAGIP